MKKKLCLALSILMIAVFIGGCNLFSHNYERDFNQTIATISSITETIKVMKEDGSELEYTYTSPEVKILKSQLNNYVQNYAEERINQGQSIEQITSELLNSIIETELAVFEADKLFYAGVLQWSVDEVDEIQRNVYAALDEEILTAKNYILSNKESQTIASNADSSQDQNLQGNSGTQTTYPIMPVKEEEKVKSENYYKTTPSPSEAVYQWHDEWYTASSWYMENSSYLSAYPGLGLVTDEVSEKTVSLELEAFKTYLSSLYVTAESIIGLSEEQRNTINREIEELKEITRLKGVSYTYPVLGKTLLIKTLIGNTYLKTKKIEKYEEYKREELNSITPSSVTFKYEDVLRNQKALFTTQSNYDTAVQNGDLILYTPTDRYLYVKHILLRFSTEQQEQLTKIASDLGYVATDEIKINEQEYLRQRNLLAQQIIAYEHVNGEDDLSKPKKAQDIFKEVKNIMAGYKNSAKHAERAFDELVYKYNMDPGFFDKIDNGYAVVYELKNGEQDTWVPEFSGAAREFRSDSKYSVGHIYDEYVVTDNGIHILYYASDTRANGEKGLHDYLTPKQEQTIYSYYEELLKSESTEYERWSSTQILLLRNTYSQIDESVLEKYIKQLKGE